MRNSCLPLHPSSTDTSKPLFIKRAPNNGGKRVAARGRADRVVAHLASLDECRYAVGSQNILL